MDNFFEHHLLINGAVFATFYGIAFTHHYLRHRKQGDAHQHAAIFATCCNPALLDAGRDFVIHILVYSGYVIPPH